MDLGFVGSKFTWSKHFANGYSIWERLDRDLANNEWLLKFPGSRVTHLRCDSSNHVPTFNNLFGLEAPPRKKVFHFEDMWLFDYCCAEIVEVA